MNLPEEFQMVAVQEVYLWILKECHYDARVFLRMLAESGAANAAKSLLASDSVQPGLRGLNRRGRLDLSIEHLVIQPHWKGLFSTEERNTARERLKRRVRRSRSSKLAEDNTCEAGRGCPLAKASL